ncbi:MAG: SCO1 protein [candidate division WS2 bacterium]|uniref:SCO1 protein n=1 Tax=Psychracetigena formicireducens TaxID=2986056 RepID=A0A9E2BIF1_PSYF1|nr:SCO1 protein [Candidatus Psychracetigena formicireducens]
MNKKILSTGVLVILLVLPVLFIVILNTGENHYEVANFPDENGKRDKYLKNMDGTIHILPDFSFTDQEGKTVGLKDVKGKIIIADYIFTRCQTICPKMTTQLERVQAAFIDNPDVVMLSHTVDPAFDSSNVLKRYAAEHGAQYGKWYFLTGDKQKLYSHAANGYKIVAREEAEGPEAFVHSEKVVLLDKLGRIRGFYDGTDSAKIDTLILETKVLLKE